MAKPVPEHVIHYGESLDTIGDVTTKRMFGGFGYFREGLMFALEYHGSLYLKADQENEAEFTGLDLPPFTFVSKDGRESTMAYWLCPETALRNQGAMQLWADSAFAAALRKTKLRPKRKKS